MLRNRIANIRSTIPQKFSLTQDRSSVHLTKYDPFSSNASSFCASLLQVVDGLVSLVLCPQIASQGPQHIRSYKLQITCDACFANQSVYLFISFDSLMTGTMHPQSSEESASGGCWKLTNTTAGLGFCNAMHIVTFSCLITKLTVHVISRRRKERGRCVHVHRRKERGRCVHVHTVSLKTFAQLQSSWAFVCLWLWLVHCPPQEDHLVTHSVLIVS